METMPPNSIAIRIITFISFWLILSSAHANLGSTVAAEDITINLGATVEWIEDSSNQLTLEQVRKLPQSSFTQGNQ